MTPIPSSHLRAGNIVQGIPFSGIICDDTPFEIFPLTAQDIWILEMGKHTCYGLPLTEEVLTKCGAQHYGNDLVDYVFFTSHGQDIGFKQASDKSFFYLVGDRWQPEINSLHQLQNLFHALSGEELTYTVT